MENAVQFITALFGGPQSTWLNAAFALGFVLVLIVLGVWVLKLFTRAGNSVVRGRNRRLAIVDQVMVDSRRQLIIVRRDNVEHLLMTGGPQDLVVEAGIAPPEPAPVRRPLPRTAAEPGHEDIDRLRELARPATQPGETYLRHNGPLRPVTVQQPGLIPTGPELRVDNPSGPAIDSAKSGMSNGSGGTRLGAGRNRFFRGIGRTDRP